MQKDENTKFLLNTVYAIFGFIGKKQKQNQTFYKVKAHRMTAIKKRMCKTIFEVKLLTWGDIYDIKLIFLFWDQMKSILFKILFNVNLMKYYLEKREKQNTRVL